MSRFEGSDGSVPVRHLKFSCKHTWKSSHPKIGEKNSCLLRVEGSGCLIGGRVPRTVPIVTRAIHHALSAVGDAAPPPARDASPEADALPQEPPAPAASTRPSCVRSPQRDSKSTRAGSHDAQAHQAVVTSARDAAFITRPVEPVKGSPPRPGSLPGGSATAVSLSGNSPG